MGNMYNGRLNIYIYIYIHSRYNRYKYIVGIIVGMICIIGIIVLSRYTSRYTTCNSKYNSRYDSYNSRYSGRAERYNSRCNTVVGIR